MNWFQKIAEEVEKVVAAAVFANGEIFTGRDHGEAADKAVAANALKIEDGRYVEVVPYTDVNLDLFVTSNGRVIDRFKAYFDFNISASEDM